MTDIAPQTGNVDIRAIEHELAALWAKVGEGDAAVTRACVLNLLILLGPDAETERRVSDVLAKLMVNCPCRALMLRLLPASAAERPLDAWVQAHCQVASPGRPQVCCEQITIQARGDAARGMPGLVLPLLMPDVPVMVWVPRGEPSELDPSGRLTRLADRLIVDSATFADASAARRRLLAIAAKGTHISDLAWGRLTPWRELTAQFFDAPALRQHLSEIEQVTVRATGDLTPGLLAAGWLASRLGWHTTADSPHGRQLVRTDGAPIAIMVDSGRDDAALIGGLTIQCRRAKFTVRPTGGRGRAEAIAAIDGMPPVQRTVDVALPDDAALIAEELRLPGRDKGYEGALRVAADLG